MSDSDRDATRAIEEWSGHDGPGMSEIFALLFFGFIGIVALGIGTSFWLGVFFDVPPPARAEAPPAAAEVDPRTAPITAEEIDSRWKP